MLAPCPCPVSYALSGEAVLSAALLATTIPDAVSSTEDQDRVFDRFDSSSPLSRY